MGDRIESMPAMLRAGLGLAGGALGRIEPLRPRRLVLMGMGGSAMAGDLLRVWADREGTVPIHVCRHYEPPAWLTPEDFLVFSSYSGETEETLAAHAASLSLGAPACVLASGGTLSARAREAGTPWIRLPGGHPPRAALGYSLSALACLAEHLGVLDQASSRVGAASDHLDGAATAWRRGVVESRNPAKRLAIRLRDRGVVLIANARTLESVALRWKGQLNENAKHLAWVSPLPEMNHNEVDSLVHPRGLAPRLTALLLTDPADHPRVARRFEWLRGHLRRRGVASERVQLEGPDPLTRMLAAVLLGDFVSYYLALLHDVDPSALPGVTLLKRFLAS
ncbi:MAG TPA: bifunctional phosphoglucose/phosphomannose isomerase, partial [Candidatus Methylomirabilis sp.]|nr:bifunctional phosphoglucose/phosphomannose isomerase [Candidatus Methylomirabilis sp.]